MGGKTHLHSKESWTRLLGRSSWADISWNLTEGDQSQTLPSLVKLGFQS